MRLRAVATFRLVSSSGHERCPTPGASSKPALIIQNLDPPTRSVVLVRGNEMLIEVKAGNQRDAIHFNDS